MGQVAAAVTAKKEPQQQPQEQPQEQQQSGGGRFFGFFKRATRQEHPVEKQVNFYKFNTKIIQQFAPKYAGV